MFDRTGTATDDESSSARRFSGPLAFRTLERHGNRPFHPAVDHLPNAMLVVDSLGGILASNGPADAIFLHGPGQLAGRRIDDLLPDLSSALNGESWSRFCDRPQTRTLGGDRPLTAVRSDGSLISIEATLKTGANAGGPYALASLTEVTERVKHEARQATAAAVQLQLQRVIADLATRLVTVDDLALDETIVDGLRQVAEALALDHAILWQKPLDESMPLPYSWSRVPQSPGAAVEMSSLLLVAAKLGPGGTACFTRVEDVPGAGEALRRQGMRSIAVIPVETSGGDALARGALAFSSRAVDQEWHPLAMEQLRVVSGILGQALVRKTAIARSSRAFDENRRTRAHPPVEPFQSRLRVGARLSRLMVCEGPALRPALAQIDQVAPTPATVLLLGETGVGKDVCAQAIHELSPRGHRQMIRVSCAAIPSALIESELFGRERGAFTGALTRQIGRFEAAHQSTLFLDEIGELPAEVQVKLLRVLQDRVIERLGSVQLIKVDVRIIAATNRNLEQAVRDKTFREDLFYRLNVFPIVVPPLRERVEDISALAWEFVDEFSKTFGKPIESISKDSMRHLQQYQWPGNVRELRNVIERAMILATGPCLTVPVPEAGATRQAPSNQTLRNLETEHIRAMLESTSWRVRGHGGAAERLGLKPTTLEGRMAKLGLTRPGRES
jgi:transcriptional regulator with GAF, ATPase, and Fis domain